MGGIGRIAKTGPALVFSLLQQLQALGLDIPSVLSQLGTGGSKVAPASAEEPIAKHTATAKPEAGDQP